MVNAQASRHDKLTKFTNTGQSQPTFELGLEPENQDNNLQVLARVESLAMELAYSLASPPEPDLPTELPCRIPAGVERLPPVSSTPYVELWGERYAPAGSSSFSEIGRLFAAL